MALKLIGSNAFRSFRNLWMLEELGVPYEYIAAFPRSSDAKAANPQFAKIPILVDGDFKMTESVAINTYLGDKFRGTENTKELVPAAGTILRGLYEQHVHCLQSELDAQGLWIHRKHEALKGVLAPPCPEAVAHAREHCEKVIAIYATIISQNGGRYILGEEFGFSACDILFVHCLNWAADINWNEQWVSESASTTDTGTVIRNYLNESTQRHAYQRTVALPAKANEPISRP
jgi:glutathione S-transferase